MSRGLRPPAFKAKTSVRTRLRVAAGLDRRPRFFRGCHGVLAHPGKKKKVRKATPTCLKPEPTGNPRERLARTVNAPCHYRRACPHLHTMAYSVTTAQRASTS
jgi:hypothetical protein